MTYYRPCVVAAALIASSPMVFGMPENDNILSRNASSPMELTSLLTDSVASRIKNERIRASRLVENTKVIQFGPSDKPELSSEDERDMIVAFYENQFRHSQDPLAPYFMFMSKDANLAMGIGGVIRMRGWYDWNGSIDTNGFVPYLIPVPRDKDNLRTLSATPAGSAIYFTIIGRNTAIGNYMGYIEANFNGYQHTGFALKNAYFTLNDWTIGYTTSTFSDPAAEPITIDGAGANGKMSKTDVLVRYLHTVKNAWSFGGSLEFPSSNVGADNVYTKKLKTYTPDLVALGQYQWDHAQSHVRLAGLFRTNAYRDLVTGREHTCIGWGVQLSCVAKICQPLTLYGITSVGQGHSSYAGDLAVGAMDLMTDPGRAGHMYSPTSASFIFGAKYSFTPTLFASVALSELRSFTRSGSPADTYKYGLYGAINLFWNITPRIQVGGEYLAGKRMNIDGNHGNANRVDAFFMVSF